MIDASALLEVLLATGVGARVLARLFREEGTLHAPYLLDLEVVHVLRRGCLIGELRPSRAAEALAVLSDLRLVRHPYEPYVPRIWRRRASAPGAEGTPAAGLWPVSISLTENAAGADPSPAAGSLEIERARNRPCPIRCKPRSAIGANRRARCVISDTLT